MIVTQVFACAVATEVAALEAPEQTAKILHLQVQEEKTGKTGSYTTDKNKPITSSPQTEANSYSLLWIYDGIYMISIIGVLVIMAVIVGVCRAAQVRGKK